MAKVHLLRWLAHVGRGDRADLREVAGKLPGLLDPKDPYAAYDLIDALDEAGLIELEDSGNWVVPSTRVVPAGASGYTISGALDDALIAALGSAGIALEFDEMLPRVVCSRAQLLEALRPLRVEWEEDAALRAIQKGILVIGAPQLRRVCAQGLERAPKGTVYVRDPKSHRRAPLPAAPTPGMLLEHLDRYSRRPSWFVYHEGAWRPYPPGWATHVAALARGQRLIELETDALATRLWAKPPRPLARAAVLAAGRPWRKSNRSWRIEDLPSPIGKLIYDVLN